MKLKKIFLITSIVFAIVLCFSIGANAETVASGTCGANGDNLTWILDDEGTLTISGTGDMDGYFSNNVPWYSNRTSIKAIIIEKGVTSIGKSAFFSCDSLKSITIPDSVTSIGYNAFENCSSLESINIPNSVTGIGGCVFSGCSSLTSITIPDSVTRIGDGVFYDCSSLTSVTIPNSVTSIGQNAFYSCISLTSMTIPDGVTSIGQNAFYSCTSLKSITIPDSVTSIDEWAFYYCISLTSMTIPDGVTSIGEYAFGLCTSLKSIIIPDGVTSISGWTFRGCSSLTSIVIPDGVTSIGDRAFRDCKSLTNVYYCGSSSEWKNITIGDDNEPLTSANIVYNCNKCELLGVVSPNGEIEKDADGNITKISVPNSVSSVTFDLIVSPGASWKMYRTDSYTSENTNKNINGLVAGNTSRKAYIRVTSADGQNTKDYAITVYRKTKATDPVINITGKTVTITGNGVIYYTTDGTAPTTSSKKYEGAFTGLSNETIKAIAVDSEKDEWSNIVTATMPTYITTTLEADYVTADSSSDTVYFGFVINTDGAPTGDFIVAVYDNNNRMVACKTVDITTATDYVEDSLTYSGTPHTYKAFFWSSLNGMTPLCNSIDGTVE